MMEEITKAVAEFYGLTPFGMRIAGRTDKDHTIAKQMASLLISEFFPKTTSGTIADYFNKTHGTIITGKKIIRGEIEVNKVRKSEYEALWLLIDKIDFKEESKFCRPVEYNLKNKQNGHI